MHLTHAQNHRTRGVTLEQAAIEADNAWIDPDDLLNVWCRWNGWPEERPGKWPGAERLQRNRAMVAATHIPSHRENATLTRILAPMFFELQQELRVW